MPALLPTQLPTKLPQQAAAYLAGHHVMTLATQGADGPWAAAVFYASDGASLIFLSAPNTRHCRNLAQDARCAVTIQEDYREWSLIKGIQLEGRVVELEGDDENAPSICMARSSRSSAQSPLFRPPSSRRWPKCAGSGSCPSASTSSTTARASATATRST
jgi:uncharacterized protein YhbP (UPF0306 family)